LGGAVDGRDAHVPADYRPVVKHDVSADVCVVEAIPGARERYGIICGGNSAGVAFALDDGLDAPRCVWVKRDAFLFEARDVVGADHAVVEGAIGRIQDIIVREDRDGGHGAAVARQPPGGIPI
jgi:hypothetical protein